MPWTIQYLIERAADACSEERLLDAHSYLTEAIVRARKVNNRLLLIDALRQLAGVERELGRAEAARNLYEEAVTRCRSESDRARLAHSVRGLGDVHLDADRVHLAEHYYVEAVTIYREATDGDLLDLANAIRPLAIIEESFGRLSSARALWSEALDLYERVGVRSGVDECLIHLAELV